MRKFSLGSLVKNLFFNRDINPVKMASQVVLSIRH